MNTFLYWIRPSLSSYTVINYSSLRSCLEFGKVRMNIEMSIIVISRLFAFCFEFYLESSNFHSQFPLSVVYHSCTTCGLMILICLTSTVLNLRPGKKGLMLKLPYFFLNIYFVKDNRIDKFYLLKCHTEKSHKIYYGIN